MREAKNLLDAKFAEFERSFKFDRRLFAADIRVNIIYCDALFNAGVVTRIESERIKNGLYTLLKRADFYKDYFDEPNASDVHAFIETRLVQLIGETGEKITIGRSRYDQSITAFRLWLREELEEISRIAGDLQTRLIDAGERQKNAVFPGYAYGRKAQPILFAHWCLAYFEMFARDRERLDEVWRRVNILPLGAADLTGTSFEIDREEIAHALGFEGISSNSLDAATDADFAVETIAAFSLLMIHLCRLTEDLILYSAPENNLIRLDDDPARAARTVQFLELTRAKAGKISGFQAELFALLKNLPLGIHKDLLEIKNTIFEATDTVKSCLQIISLILETMRVEENATQQAVTSEYLNAVELGDYLVHRGVSVRNAREIVDRIVALAVSQKKRLADLSLDELQSFSKIIDSDVQQALNLEQSLASKNQIGGTAPERVFEALESARENLEREKDGAH